MRRGTVGGGNGTPTSGSSESAASSWASSAASVPRRPGSRTCSTSGRTWDTGRPGRDRCRERQNQRAKHRGGRGGRERKLGRQSDHILVLREGFRGQIPSQHALTRVGTKLFITRDGFLRQRGTSRGCWSIWGARGRARGQHAHGEDGGHLVEGRDEDADLADAGGQEQGPGRLSVGFAVAEDLRTSNRHGSRRP